GAISNSGLEMYFFDGSYTKSKHVRTAYGQPWTQVPDDLPATLGPLDFGADDLRIIAGSRKDPLDINSSLVEYQRTSVGAAWMPSPGTLGIGPGNFGVTGPSLSRDGLELFYEVHTSNHAQIWHTHRASLISA